MSLLTLSIVQVGTGPSLGLVITSNKYTIYYTHVEYLIWIQFSLKYVPNVVYLVTVSGVCLY